MAERFECPGCGYSLGPNEKECKYCGTKNPNYKEPALKILQQTPPAQVQQAPATNQKSFSVVAFILLLIFFWPGAIIYAVVKLASQ